MPARPQHSPLAIAAGGRLRELRERRGISVTKLAAEAGLGKGTLSELETGRRNPTLHTLFAVTTALGVPLSAVLPPVQATDPEAPIRGEAIDAVLVERYEDASAVIEVYRTTLRAGREQRSDPHAKGVTERWIVYGGEMELGPLDEPVYLRAGESAAFRADVPHSYTVAEGEDVAATLLVRYPR